MMKMIVINSEKKGVNVMIRAQGSDTWRLNTKSGRVEDYCTFCYMSGRPSHKHWRNWLYRGYPVYSWWGVGSRPEKEVNEEDEEDIFY